MVAQASSVGEVWRKVVYDRMRAWRQKQESERYTDLRLLAQVICCQKMFVSVWF